MTFFSQPEYVQGTTARDVIAAEGSKTLSYSTRISRVESTGLWLSRSTASIQQPRLELLDVGMFVETEDVSGEMLDAFDTGTVANAYAYFMNTDDPALADATLDRIVEVCDSESADLTTAATRLRTAVREDEGIVDQPVTRLVVLDSVSVIECCRGLGIGRRVAAENLYAAGAWAETTLIVAIAGARVNILDTHSHHEITTKARSLLVAIGLTEYETSTGPVFVGHSAYASPGSDLFDLVHGR